MSTVYRDSDVTCTLDDGLDRWVRGLLSAAERVTIAEMEAAANEVATEARAAWYGSGGVTKETGLSGDIQVKTTIDNGKGEVRVSVGSVDKRRAFKGGKPVVVYIHRPGPAGTIRVQVTPAEYWATTESLRANWNPYKPNPANGWPGDPPGSGPFVYRTNPKASDGKFLLSEFVKRPMSAKIKLLAKDLGKRIVAAARVA